MGNLTTALVFVMCLNVFMWLSQVAILDLNPSGTNFYNCEGSILNQFGTDCDNPSQAVIHNDPAAMLPSSQNIDTESNVFTDLFNNILSWFKGVTGIGYLIDIVKAPYNLLMSIGAPQELAFGLGALWYGVTFFIVISFLWGRD